MSGGSGNGFGDDLPWASIFDSAANIRALTEIQADGLRAASKLVDRMVKATVEGAEGLRVAREPSADPNVDDHRADVWGATAVEPLLRSWWSMIADIYLGRQPAGAAGSNGPVPGQVALDFAAATSVGRLELDTVAGGAAVAEVWLHNRGAADLGHIHLRCSDLQSDLGRVIGSDAVKLDPALVPMPARSSRGIEIRVEVAADTAPGSYRGNLLPEGHPDLWLPVVLTVRAALV